MLGIILIMRINRHAKDKPMMFLITKKSQSALEYMMTAMLIAIF